MSRLLALDPALREPAWAYFEYGKLVSTCAVKLPSKLLREKNQAERLRLIADAIVTSLDGLAPDEFVWEHMEVYGKGKGKSRGPQKRVDPDDLLRIATMAGCVAGRLNLPSTYFQPKTWLGGSSSKNKDAPWASARGARAKHALSAKEFALVEDCTHDELDAVCIGLYKLGRFPLLRVLPGAV